MADNAGQPALPLKVIAAAELAAPPEAPSPSPAPALPVRIVLGGPADAPYRAPADSA